MIPALLISLLAATPEPRTTGGAAAPAALPAGTNALYGFVGAPEVAVGYRQGFGVLELDGRASFNLFKVSFIGDVALKFPVYQRQGLRLAPLLSLGVEFNTGATYFDLTNFDFIGLRPRVGFLASYAFTETISGVAQLDLPVSVALTTRGFVVTPTVGVGAEFHLGGGFSLLLAGLVGFEATQEARNPTFYRAAWGARLGVGYRLF